MRLSNTKLSAQPGCTKCLKKAEMTNNQGKRYYNKHTFKKQDKQQ